MMKCGATSGAVALAASAVLSAGLVFGFGHIASARSEAWRLEQARPSVLPDPAVGGRVELRADRYLGDRPSGPLLVVLAGACSTCSTEPLRPLERIDPRSYSRVVVVVQGSRGEVARWRDRVPEPAHLYADEDGSLTASLAPRFVPRSHLLEADGRLAAFQQTPIDDPNLPLGDRS